MEEKVKSILEGMDRSLMPPPETVHICLWTGTRVKWSVEAMAGIVEYGMKKDPYS